MTKAFNKNHFHKKGKFTPDQTRYQLIFHVVAKVGERFLSQLNFNAKRLQNDKKSGVK